MNATVGVALATLLVAGSILAGPTVLECSRDSNGFGACLRDKIGAGGLLAPDARQPDVVADVPSDAPLPSPVAGGWMEANANEYEPPASVPVELNATAADLAAAELAPASEAPVEVAIVPPMELAIGTSAPPGEGAAVMLDGAGLDLVAEGTPSSDPEPPAEVALVGPQGAVTAMSPVPEVSADAGATLTMADGLQAAGADGETSVAVVAPEPAPVTVEATPEAPPAIVFNPQYPNVLVLPPPASGDNSSFRSLQLN